MEIRKYTKDLIPDVIDFEKRLREEEDFIGDHGEGMFEFEKKMK